MESKIIHALGRDWLWPKQDEKCCAVVFDWSKDLEIVYEHVEQFRTCIQAGGNMGVWPWLLSKKFKQVYTFEADRRLQPYLYANLHGTPNVHVSGKGLWDRPGSGEIRDAKANNLGAQYVVEDALGSVELACIDDYAFVEVDLIYLDIEGAEMKALRGAADTIAECRPTIVVEDKSLSEKFGTKKGDIERWLARDFGYEVVARPHRDVVMVCE